MDVLWRACKHHAFFFPRLPHGVLFMHFPLLLLLPAKGTLRRKKEPLPFWGIEALFLRKETSLFPYLKTTRKRWVFLSDQISLQIGFSLRWRLWPFNTWAQYFFSFSFSAEGEIHNERSSGLLHSNRIWNVMQWKSVGRRHRRQAYRALLPSFLPPFIRHSLKPFFVSVPGRYIGNGHRHRPIIDICGWDMMHSRIKEGETEATQWKKETHFHSE